MNQEKVLVHTAAPQRLPPHFPTTLSHDSGMVTNNYTALEIGRSSIQLLPIPNLPFVGPSVPNDVLLGS
jgi:hypothetical protein